MRCSRGAQNGKNEGTGEGKVQGHSIIGGKKNNTGGTGIKGGGRGTDFKKRRRKQKPKRLEIKKTERLERELELPRSLTA